MRTTSTFTLLCAALVSSSCRGSSVDVDFVATPSFTARRLELLAVDAQRSPVATVFLPDAGLALPRSLRMLVDGPTLALSATAYDAFGEPRQASARAEGLRAGGSAQVTLDFSALPAVCPAAATDAGIVEVAYGEGYAPGWEGYGYHGALVETTGAERCSGDKALRYQATKTDNDGIVFVFPSTSPAALSFRLWLSSGVPASLSTGDQTTETGAIWQLFPCDPNCDAALVAGWQRISAELPANAINVKKLLLNVNNPPAGLTFIVDDVRLVRR